MPPWAATPVLPLLLLVLLLLLVVRGRGGHGAITIGGLDMDMDVGVEAAQMGSEAAHGRLLWETGGGRRYISYDALRGDAVPCSRPGVPYYNCRVSTTANPYTRGCDSITRCRDDDPS
ncbi:protein RALF-like 33 [Hordeum vulgare subsp. vulgare]|uniref:Protein RALF-like 33 n=1 Tax=Hordeum vulgare subsp. vulgare TaxID=112509 RepID=A0A8I6X8N5_HORVV|nr:protein RALF-like 33 [Hordeum vulgare subsp. vulgare]KAI5009918.1 hypothetical protein ZWY2020_012055 [Hordeum vulgare]